MDTSKEVEGGGNNNKQQKHESEAVKGGGGDSIRKGRSCIGYHYFSSSLKSSNGKPRCIGLPRTLQQVPNEAIRSSEAKALEYGGRTLLDFYYSCTGYSIYINVQDDVEQTKRIELPACIGLEHLWDVKVTSGDTGSTPAPTHSKVESLRIQLLSEPISGDTASAPAPVPVHTCSMEEACEFLQPRVHNKPAHSSGDDFLSRRFIRNANLVASGVAKNMLRVGNYVKESIDDILFPYRK